MHNNEDKRPASSALEPKGDLGHSDKTWTPAEGEQGISNRPDDDPNVVPPGNEADDAESFGEDQHGNAEDDDD